MPDPHGEPTYMEALAAGLYGEQQTTPADPTFTTYGVQGPGTPPKLGATQHEPGVIVQGMRS